MKLHRHMRWWSIAMVLGAGTLLQSGCVTQLRDAALGGLSQFITTAVNSLLTELLLNPMLEDTARLLTV